MKRRRTPRRPGLDDQRYLNNRARLKLVGDHICAWCRYPIDLQIPYPHPLSWSCDHKIPRSRLAPDDPRNWDLAFLLEAHMRCNQARGAKPLPVTRLSDPGPSIDW